jgi:ariadne-1
MDEEDYEYDDDADYHYEDDDMAEDDCDHSVDEQPAEAKDDRRASSASAKGDAGDAKSAQSPLGKAAASSPATGGLAMGSSASAKLSIPYDSYIVRPQSDVALAMNRIVDDVSALLDVSADEAQLLLQQHKWDKDRLLDAFLADYDAVRQAAGVDLFSAAVLDDLAPRQPPPSSSQAALTFRCRIRVCCDEVCPWAEGYALGCQHRFCRACYAEYLKAAVQDGPQCTRTHCPEHKCTQVVPRSVFQHFVASGSEEREKYDRYVLRSFVETNKNMRYCPAPRCDMVAMGAGSVQSVRCSCGHHFCFRCGEEAHEPASCAQLAQWLEKCVNESETANWILANTRKCPQCGTRIEKNQGCNHMSCRQCKHEFCWICMGGWAEHGQQTGGFYKCNRFDPAELPSSVTEAQRAKAELDRYLHYYQRYHGHDQGLTFAERLRDAAERRMLEQQETSRAHWIDVQFLKEAAEQVRDCRRVLKNTYILGYHLRDRTAEKQLFEHHQEMLEKHTERLQEFTEKPVEQLQRADVVNLTRVTERFLDALLQNMSGGVVRIDEVSRAAPVAAAATADAPAQRK